MTRAQTVAIIAAILAASDDVARVLAKTELSSNPARCIDDAEEIYAEAIKREDAKRYPGA